ncbi:DUF6629 family protein [Mangrovibacterium lignilyticum]|uniref:DUF6629 family protein n=1 Tax=Mangrovibacterium lignilyticum TaxID=2668052 RepID=UPI0013D26DBA|nr:DUF6629 family protein [Mangrovibacterium lignilyticum]
MGKFSTSALAKFGDRNVAMLGGAEKRINTLRSSCYGAPQKQILSALICVNRELYRTFYFLRIHEYEFYSNRKGKYMCFSPEASFASGAIITAIGFATVKKVHHPAQLVFAGIPLFFGVQQIAEGVLWLSLLSGGSETIRIFSTYFFLIMAEVIWPSLIPLSVFLMEKNEKRKKILRGLLFAGMLLSGYYAFCLLSYYVSPRIVYFHVQYNNDFPTSLALPAFCLYLIVTIVPLFVSEVRKTKWLGILMLLSCTVTILFFRQYLTSVWCFFAALISGVVYWILHSSKEKFKLGKIQF